MVVSVCMLMGISHSDGPQCALCHLGRGCSGISHKVACNNQIAYWRNFFLVALVGSASSVYGTEDNLSDSRFRPVQFYDDPTKRLW